MSAAPPIEKILKKEFTLEPLKPQLCQTVLRSASLNSELGKIAKMVISDQIKII